MTALVICAPFELCEYFKAERAVVCELDVPPYHCEFWPLGQLAGYNEECQVHTYAPGYFGFGTSGGGEMFAISPDGAVVCLPFIGMSPVEELVLAPTWSEFESLLKDAA